MSGPTIDDIPRDLLASLKLLEGIPYEQIAPVLARCAMRRLEPGEILLEPGRSNRHIFLVLTGRLQVHLEAADSVLGFAINAGECVGEMSVIDGRPTSAFVVADEPSTLLAVDEVCFWSELTPLPGFTRNLLRLVSARMRSRNDVMLAAQEQKLRVQELDKELATAREIQASMLPQQTPLLPGHPQIDTHVLMEPAKEVGGDFYDVFALDAARVCLVVGDVSGKGMPAALFMVRALTLLRGEAQASNSIERMIRRLNGALCANNASCMFLTLCAAVVDVESGETVILSAGHDAPIARLGGGGWDFLPKPAGPLIGFTDRAEFATYRLKLEPTDMLILFTDGVTEAENPQGGQYTAERLRESLDLAWLGDAASAVRYVRNCVAEYAAGQAQSDDITIFALRFLG